MNKHTILRYKGYIERETKKIQEIAKKAKDCNKKYRKEKLVCQKKILGYKEYIERCR